MHTDLYCDMTQKAESLHSVIHLFFFFLNINEICPCMGSSCDSICPNPGSRSELSQCKYPFLYNIVLQSLPNPLLKMNNDKL